MPFFTVIEERYHGDRDHLGNKYTEAADIKSEEESVRYELMSKCYNREYDKSRLGSFAKEIHRKYHKRSEEHPLSPEQDIKGKDTCDRRYLNVHLPLGFPDHEYQKACQETDDHTPTCKNIMEMTITIAAKIKRDLRYQSQESKPGGVFLNRSRMDKTFRDKEEKYGRGKHLSVHEKSQNPVRQRGKMLYSDKHHHVTCAHKEQRNVLKQITVDRSYTVVTLRLFHTHVTP